MMGFLEGVKEIENILERYRNLIGIVVLIMLIVLSFLTYTFFDKQNQIIETGGYVNGNIRCVCTEDAYNNFKNHNKINISKEFILNGTFDS